MCARWCLIFGLFALTWLRIARGNAAEPLALTYDCVPGCPTQDVTFADVASQVRDASRAAGAKFELRIVATESGFSGELVATDAAGERSRRRIEGQTCTEVAHALAFLTAVAVELRGRLEDTPLQASTPTPTPEALPGPTMRAPLPRTPKRGPWAVAVMALGEMRAALAPEPLLSTTVGIELEREVTPIVAPSVLFSIDETSGHLVAVAGTAELWMVSGRIDLCPLRLGSSSIALRPCAEAELGAVHAAGQIPVNPHAVTEPWAALGAVLRARWFVARHFFVEAEFAAELPLVRTRYFFEPDETLYVTPPATGRGGFGLGLLL
jgi:hypothetical protein